MRRAPNCVLCLIAFAPAALHASSNLRSPNLTIVMGVTGPFSDKAVSEMQQETDGIMKEAGLRLEWISLSEAMESSHSDLVVVRFKGSCVLDPGSVKEYPPSAGPLAFTYISDGIVQPFSEVSCDKVAAAVRSVLRPGDFPRADSLLGRALGRVLAHELVHMLTGSEAHGRDGVAKAALSGKELISNNSLQLSPNDLERLRWIYGRPSMARAGR
jgi:hypothetical protein